MINKYCYLDSAYSLLLIISHVYNINAFMIFIC